MKVSFGSDQVVRPPFQEGCPTRTVLDHIMSRWGVLVLSALSHGTRRWGELRRAVDGISEKMLVSTLRTLVADGLVERTAHPTVPPHVDYALTDRGHDLMVHLLPLLDWVAEHTAEIVESDHDLHSDVVTSRPAPAKA